MQISLLIPHLDICGGVRRYVEIANRLVERGHEVNLYHTKGTPCSWTVCRATIAPTEEILNHHHEVFIHSYYSNEELRIAKTIKARLKIYYVLNLYDHKLMQGFNPLLYLRKNFKTLYTKKNILSGEVIFTNSSWQHKWIQRNLGVENTLLLGGVNFNLFYPIPKVKADNGIKILYTGTRRDWKNTKIIEEALSILRVKYPTIHTDTYYRKNLHQDQMAAFYAQGDIFVDAQLYGGWNNPVAEAMACKVPVVCSDIGSVQDFAFHNKTALLFKSEDLQNLIMNIERLILDVKLRHELAYNAYRSISKFTWQKSIDIMEKLLYSALQQSNDYSHH